ncbi:MAG: hypothetical protein ACWGMZ_03875 [Thermoguttaceae bacterium]
MILDRRVKFAIWSIFAFGILLGVAKAAEQDATVHGESNLPAPIATRQTFFSIPFRVDQSEDAARRPVEVQLLVSQDYGAHWRLYARVQPSEKQIPLRASGDGEYWFAIRTVDRAGGFHPEKIPGPGLRVIVDTKPPQMQLSAQYGPAGQITTLWQIDDAHPKPDSFALQYRTSSGDPWQSVALTEKNSTVSGSLQTGEVSWWPQPGTHEIEIRGEVTDTAGNKSVSHAQVKIGSDAARAGQTPFSAPHANAPFKPVSERINPSIGNRYASEKGKLIDPELSMLPAGERPKMINSRMFELDYDLESVGSSGISRIELWCTRDGGRNWRMLTVDDDNRSPISVSVDEEGIYGFRILATSGAGLGQHAPKSGDLPEIWVGIDLTKPIARIISAELGKGDEEGRLNIAWEAADKMLAERPITLSFSENADGPWTPIAAGLENSGHYSWVLDSRSPPLIYLRLEARDEAGNLASQVSNQAIPLDQMRPTATIKDVRAAAKN